MMKVALFPDLKLEGWPSMDLYAARLWENLPHYMDGADISRADAGLPGMLVRDSAFTRPSRYFCRYLLYPALARTVKADVYHVLDHSYGHLMREIDPARTVLTLHDLYPLYLLRESTRGMRQRVRNRLLRQVMQHALRAARLIVNSRFIADELSSQTDYPSERIRLIPLGVDENFFEARDERGCHEVRELLGLGDDQTLVLHVGSCDPRKDIPTLLQTLHLLRQRMNPPPSLVQVGGCFTRAYRTQISSLGLEDAVIQRSRVPKPVLHALYQAADVLVFPSVYEGFGLPLLEAMAVGTPIVASRIGPVRELVGNFGALVEAHHPEAFADAIIELLADRAGTRERAVQGARRARAFSWRETTRHTAAVYQELYR